MRKIESEPGHWQAKWQSGNKFLMKHDKTGEVRQVTRDPEGIKKGDYLQPTGREKDAFLQKYGSLPTESKEETDKYLLRRGLLKNG